MNTWNTGIKDVCRELAEKRARELELEWMNDYMNEEKFKAASDAWNEVKKYN